MNRMTLCRRVVKTAPILFNRHSLTLVYATMFQNDVAYTC